MFCVDLSAPPPSVFGVAVACYWFVARFYSIFCRNLAAPPLFVLGVFGVFRSCVCYWFVAGLLSSLLVLPLVETFVFLFHILTCVSRSRCRFVKRVHRAAWASVMLSLQLVLLLVRTLVSVQIVSQSRCRPLSRCSMLLRFRWGSSFSPSRVSAATVPLYAAFSKICMYRVCVFSEICSFLSASDFTLVHRVFVCGQISDCRA